MKGMRNRNQQGSTHIAIISVIALIILGVIGFLFWNNFMQQKDEVVPSANTKPPISTSPTPVASSDVSKLVISDWKIEFTIPEVLKNTSVKYFERKTNDDPPRTNYVFTTSRIQALGGKCMESPFGDTVTLSRFAEDPGPLHILIG